MISAQQQAELRTKYNPDGSRQRAIQLHLLDMLAEFDRICKENNIEYWLDSGTLIGAARHSGFIPWDDDLDVCILKKDVKRLKRAVEKEATTTYKIIDASCNNNHFHRWPRFVNESIIIDREIKEADGSFSPKRENLWLDIFLQTEGTPETARKINEIYGRCFRRRYKIKNDGLVNYIIGTALYPVCILFENIYSLYRRVISGNELIHAIGSGFYSVRHKSDIFPLGEIEFENKMYPAPKDYDSYLRRIYGDYTLLPKEEDICTHNYKNIEYKKI